MRALAQIAFCCLLAATGAQAQRGGGHMGGMGRGSFGGGGFRGGFARGGFRGGFNNGFRYPGNRFIVTNRGFGFGNRFIRPGFWGWPVWGWPTWGWSSWGWPVWGWSSWGWPAWGGPSWGWPAWGGPSWGWGGWTGSAAASRPDDSNTYAYRYGSGLSSYAQAQPAAAPANVDQEGPVLREYDEYGQDAGRSSGRDEGSGSPIYLIALKNQTIYAAIAYSVKGNTLSFLTTSHEQMRAPLDLIDRGLSSQLNRERHINFQLPY